jgi:hypothetical protein
MRSAGGDLFRVRIAATDAMGNEISVSSLKKGDWPKGVSKGRLVAPRSARNVWLVESPDGPIQLQIVRRDDWSDVLIQRFVDGKVEPFAAIGWCKDRLPPTTSALATEETHPFDPARWIAHACYLLSPSSSAAAGPFSMAWTKDGTETWILSDPKNTIWTKPVVVKYYRDPSGDVGSEDGAKGVTFKFSSDGDKPEVVGEYFILWNPKSLVASSVFQFTANRPLLGICGEKASRSSEKGIKFE